MVTHKNVQAIVDDLIDDPPKLAALVAQVFPNGKLHRLFVANEDAAEDLRAAWCAKVSCLQERSATPCARPLSCLPAQK
jgi:hypothetical protein